MQNKTKLLLSSDPMDMPAGQIDTSFPKIREGVHKMVVRDPKAEPGKKDPNVFRLTFSLETIDETVSTDGAKLYPGFKFREAVNGASGERTAAAVAKDTAALIQAFDGKDSTITPKQLWDNPSLMADKVLYVKVGIQAAKDGFPEKNKASAYIDPSKVK